MWQLVVVQLLVQDGKHEQGVARQTMQQVQAEPALAVFVADAGEPLAQDWWLQQQVQSLQQEQRKVMPCC
jgi:hypothetical protein